MKTEIVIVNRQRCFPVKKAHIQNIVDLVLQALIIDLSSQPSDLLSKKFLNSFSKRAKISLSLVSNLQIKKLNSKWRQKNVATDVLSFPLALEPPPVGLEWEIGEIVLSVEKAQQQADMLGHNFEREIAFLFAHGLLHVLGFDHQSASEEKEMLCRQKRILKAAGFQRA